MAQAIRITNKNALMVPEVQKIIAAALASAPNILGTLEDAGYEYMQMIENPRFGVFVGVEAGEYKAFCIVMLPQGKVILQPQCWAFYNEGTPKCRDALIKACIDFIVQNGYTKFWSINASGRADKAWQKVFGAAGKSYKIGSVMGFSVD